MRFLRKEKCTELNKGLRAVNYNPEKEKKQINSCKIQILLVMFPSVVSLP